MDPRVVRTHAAVRSATLVVLGNRGYAAFTVEAVAEAAGIAKSTIYRHWPTKLALIADALETLNVQPSPDSATGTHRERVEMLVGHLAAAFTDSVLSACIPALIEAAEHHPEVADFLYGYSAVRRQVLVETLTDGVRAGAFPKDLDPELAALALSGPIIYQRTMTPDPFDPSRTGALVDLVLGSRHRPEI